MKKLLVLITVLLFTVSTFAQKEKIYLTVHTTIFIKNNVSSTYHTKSKIEFNADMSRMKLISPSGTFFYLVFKGKTYKENEFLYLEGSAIETKSKSSLGIYIAVNVLTEEFHITLSGFEGDDYDKLMLIAK